MYHIYLTMIGNRRRDVATSSRVQREVISRRAETKLQCCEVKNGKKLRELHAMHNRAYIVPHIRSRRSRQRALLLSFEIDFRLILLHAEIYEGDVYDVILKSQDSTDCE